MKKKSFYVHLELKYKLLLISLIAGFIPMLIIGIFGYNQIESLLYEREKEVLEEKLNQTTQHLNDKLHTYNNSLSHILINQSLKQKLNQSFDTNYDMYIFFRDVLNPLFINTLALNRDFKQITLFTDININSHDRFLRPLSDIEYLPWYDRFNESPYVLSYLSDKPTTFNIAAELFTDNRGTRSIINITIDYHALFGSLSSIYEDDFGIFIMEGDELLFGYQKENNQDYNYLGGESLVNHVDDIENDYIIQRTRIPSTHWEITLMRPVSVINQPLGTIIVAFIFVLITSFVFLIGLSFILARRIIVPIESLAENMKAIDSDNFNITVESNSKDEINTLIRAFKKMVTRIDRLVNQVYQEKLQKKDYELKALQAQINPHFFYNALSLINSKAIVANQSDISLMTQYLSTFYRTSLNKGKDFLPLSEEMNNVKSYLSIQQMMHDHSFDYFINTPKELDDFDVPNLILQPLIENAIHHGIDESPDNRRGLIVVEGTITADYLELMVSDNGKGMQPEELKEILNKASNGYGVRNVHNRIQLYFGEQYGLNYSSILNKGTVVILRLPSTKKEQS